MNDNKSFDRDLANSRLHPGLEGTKINNSNHSNDNTVKHIGNNFAKGVIRQ